MLKVLLDMVKNAKHRKLDLNNNSTTVMKKLLIANRGEIACRIIDTAREMGIRTVAVYSEADRTSLHVDLADEAVFIGASPVRESYLDIEKIINTAKETGADAIHPGYGFLSENAEFCRSCADNQILFVGPSADAISSMGSKSAAKKIMEKAGVPLVPGYHNEDQSPATLRKHSDETGYPVLLKASAGGGGKGMRIVWNADEFDESLDSAKREAMASFGDDKMLVEKYLTQPRHVEIQIFCDKQGDGVYLFERDCSVQRRHQKVIEESPAPGMTHELRSAMGKAALQAAEAINYEGAGTVEFLLDKDGSFYFMEMNTRLQVEHPVTEMVTNQDLVEWQLKVACGEPLPLAQNQLKLSGHAFEARIYAEDPENDFLPASGIISYLKTPAISRHVRVDTGVRQGDEVSVYYDPMIAKLIVWDESREKALMRLSSALREFQVAGMKTNTIFLYSLANNQTFRDGDFDTSFIAKHQKELFRKAELDTSIHLPLIALYLILHQEKSASQSAASSLEPNSPWNYSNAWRLNETLAQEFKLEIQQKEYTAEVEQRKRREQLIYKISFNGVVAEAFGELDGELLRANLNGHQHRVYVSGDENSYSLFVDDLHVDFKVSQPDLGLDEEAALGHGLAAPMNGTVVALLVGPGEKVKKDDALLVMEAMKMEHTIRAPCDGKVLEFFYQAKDLIDGGSEILSFEEN